MAGESLYLTNLSVNASVVGVAGEWLHAFALAAS